MTQVHTKKVVNFKQANSSDQLFPNPPLLSSHGQGWQDIAFEYHRQPPHDTTKHQVTNHAIAAILSPGPVDRWLDGKFQRETLTPGNLAIIPAYVEHRSQWLGHEVEFAVAALNPDFLAQTGKDWVNPDHVELIPQFGTLRDPLLRGILTAFKEELEASDAGPSLYIEQLNTTLAMHLLKKYATCPAQVREYDDGLSCYQLRQAIDYIQAHLSENIRLADVADQLGMSQYYFCRLFRQSMGLPPYQYLIQQRIEQAKQLLRKERKRAIADIALDCGFSSQSHLAKHFRQVTGATPKAYRGR